MRHPGILTIERNRGDTVSGRLGARWRPVEACQGGVAPGVSPGGLHGLLWRFGGGSPLGLPSRVCLSARRHSAPRRWWRRSRPIALEASDATERFSWLSITKVLRANYVV